VLAALGLHHLIGRPPPRSSRSTAGGSDEDRVLSFLSGRTSSLEEISAAAGVELHRTLVAMAGLELRGLAEARGGRYRRAPQKPKKLKKSKKSKDGRGPAGPYREQPSGARTSG
jgi:hypothetical protein